MGGTSTFLPQKSTHVYIITTYNRILVVSASLKHVWLHISGQAAVS